MAPTTMQTGSLTAPTRVVQPPSFARAVVLVVPVERVASVGSAATAESLAVAVR
jgi:hypothetical protein